MRALYAVLAFAGGVLGGYAGAARAVSSIEARRVQRVMAENRAAIEYELSRPLIGRRP